MGEQRKRGLGVKVGSLRLWVFIPHPRRGGGWEGRWLPSGGPLHPSSQPHARPLQPCHPPRGPGPVVSQRSLLPLRLPWLNRHPRPRHLWPVPTVPASAPCGAATLCRTRGRGAQRPSGPEPGLRAWGLRPPSVNRETPASGRAGTVRDPHSLPGRSPYRGGDGYLGSWVGIQEHPPLSLHHPKCS